MGIEALLKLKGWRRRGIAVLLGVCAVGALPPFYVLPLLVPAFSGLFLLVHTAAGKRQAFSDGWWWGLGYFTAGLYWICISLWVEPATFAWFTPFALFGLPSILAIYIGLVTLALYGIRIHDTCHVSCVTCFAAIWVLAEYLRSYLFTGFPWNLIGYVWTVSDATLQFASVAGIYGLSWITVLAATMPALWVLKKADAMRPTVLAALLLLAMTGFGIVRLAAHPTQYTSTKVRIVQANVSQSLKWDPKGAIEGLRKNIRLTRSLGLDSVNLVLWPETAVPYYVTPHSRLTQDLGSILPPSALLVTGGMRGGSTRAEAWNSVFVIDGEGNIKAEYDKHHLVPFGEYIPLRGIVPVEWIVADMGDFARGPGPQTLNVAPYPPFSPLVCYEAIFPDEVTDGTHRAEWLFSLTDDAWFGASTGPLQDVQMARTRAVEQGLPMLRASNTGVSAVFDAFGRTIASLPLEKEGVLDLYIPLAEQGQAIIGRYPRSGFLFIIAAGIVFLSFRLKKPRAFL
jgi:apolipoprotein N-acyltransferase